ncbi:hypothetical protein WJX79_004091 [Trebouxia sp. C0005]
MQRRLSIDMIEVRLLLPLIATHCQECLSLHGKRVQRFAVSQGGQSHLSDTIPDVARVSNQSFCIFGFAARRRRDASLAAVPAEAADQSVLDQ